MARQTATQKRLLTFRQGVIILAIFVLSLFAFKYAQNIMRIHANQRELAALDEAIARVKDQQAAADENFVNSISPAEVGDFAKNEMGWVQKGEMIYVPVPMKSTTDDEATAAKTDSGAAAEKTPSNWQLWLALVTDKPEGQ